jgi:hypothetical protein
MPPEARRKTEKSRHAKPHALGRPSAYTCTGGRLGAKFWGTATAIDRPMPLKRPKSLFASFSSEKEDSSCPEGKAP